MVRYGLVGPGLAGFGWVGHVKSRALSGGLSRRLTIGLSKYKVRRGVGLGPPLSCAQTQVPRMQDSPHIISLLRRSWKFISRRWSS